MKKKMLLVLAAAAFAFVLVSGTGKSSVTLAAQGPVYQNNIMNVIVASSDGNVSFRTGPGLEFGVISLIYNGTALRITGVSQNTSDGLVWGMTSYNGMNGWISLMWTRVYDIETASKAVYDVTVSQADLIYLRQGPGTEYTSVYRPYKGQVLRIDQTMVNSFDGRPWGRTVVNGMQGWVSLNWTTRNNGSTYNQAKDVTFTENIYNVQVSAPQGVYFYQGPGKSYPVYDSVRIGSGTTLFVTAVLNNSQDGIVWGQTTYNGSAGWIPMNDMRVISINHSGSIQYYVTVQNSGNIKLRMGPGTEYQTLVNVIPDNTVLLITETIINSFDGRPWGKTVYNGTQGWVSLNWTWRGPGR